MEQKTYIAPKCYVVQLNLSKDIAEDGLPIGGESYYTDEPEAKQYDFDFITEEEDFYEDSMEEWASH